jgi:hypothetical protein
MKLVELYAVMFTHYAAASVTYLKVERPHEKVDAD